jgi:hypothetical protein
MAMELPMLVKALCKPRNVLQELGKQEMWYVQKYALSFFQCFAN